ncbi:DUF72 domain-containing protein [Candidimonas sp. SYP-B2681]|uniref:DUF72 domain-containing protein n=1 Tax=Candidimonas sp. SYP-B2681 TaxID=2497686 RepID=UPI000F88DAA5|nr:DUF72 domain-containing protein [Candidimonas sp. SYP-B2681]RTZ47854.1 DUF72 domain-containing protein [Candidimonas sp. SYP-B2681]
MRHTHIGISGWRYAGWRKSFYPSDLAQTRELEFASRQVQTIEINGSFYSLQTPERYDNWYQATPPSFIFSVKGPRYLTHVLRFTDGIRTLPAIANFFASGVFKLREKLGPVLWQFPPSYQYDEGKMEFILQLLPRNTDEASRLAAQHDERVKHPLITTTKRHRLRHAIEVRHPSFCDDSFITLLRKYHAAMVVSDSVKRDWPYAEDLTSDFVYMRLHGTETLYGGKYSDAALDRWASRIQVWARGHEPDDPRRISVKPATRRATRDVFCYFDNDQKVQAPFDARRLLERLPAKP